MPAAEVRVALLGYGCVGSAVDRLLTERGEQIERATGFRLCVVRALVRDRGKPRSFQPRPGVLTTDFPEIRDDASVDVVAEVIGGIDPAERYLHELLAAGKPVVTANKQLLARRGSDLAAVANAAGLPIRFEAAVCGAIPVVRTLCEALAPGTVERIVGVVNGTTNFILARVEEGRPFEEALDEARGLGYAEADPADDLSGADAAAKMALLASIAFGRAVALDEVERTGIENLSANDLATARAAGRRIRLVGEAGMQAGALTIRVAPTALREGDPLALAPAASNHVVLEGHGFGRLDLAGPGAGGPETATAVVSDLLALARGAATSHITRLATSKSVRAVAS